MAAPAEPPAENAAAAEAPDLPADPAEEMELDNEDEDGGAEDVADANNGAQGMTALIKKMRHFSNANWCKKLLDCNIVFVLCRWYELECSGMGSCSWRAHLGKGETMCCM